MVVTMSPRVPETAAPPLSHEGRGGKGREGKFHDQGDAKWIVIRQPLRGHSAAPRLAALRAYLVFLVTIN
jgi:hypothetical protein